MEKEEYIKPQTVVVLIDHAELLDDNNNMKVSNHEGYHPGGPGAKEYDFDEEDVEADKWGTTLPTSVPDAWKSVGE